MRMMSWVIIAFGAALGLTGCGGDEAEPGSSSKPEPTFVERHGGFCLTPIDVQVSAGATFDPDASTRELRHLVKSPVISTYTAQIRRARRLAADETDQQIRTLWREIRVGLMQLKRDPELLRSGRVPAFRRAREFAKEAGLTSCSPVMNPGG